MSQDTGTYPELLYASYVASTNLANFTTEDNLMKTLPVCRVRGSLFNSVGRYSTSLKAKFRGQVGTTGAPTFTFTLRLITSTTWSAGGLILGSSSAIVAASGVTLAPWELEADIGLRTIEANGGTATVVTMATVGGPGFPSDGAIPANNVAPTLATIDVSATYFLYLSAACGTANALNLINCQMAKVYGEN